GVAGSAGLTNQAMQQGDIGLLMTTLLISAPPMAAAFFGGTMGSFSSVSQVSAGAGAQANASGMPGQAGYQPAATTQSKAPYGGGGGGMDQRQVSSNVPPSQSATQRPVDEIKTASVPPPPKALKVDGEA
ncbi:hypothetical protein, partial [Variovorax sp. ZT4R33]|uniref:hypothetical protein n=1 Tax=Variovorax sp. ZT4R33 TaxID=3443743 RepID=UPI003F489E3C